MRVTIVAALSENGVIGRGGDLPWHLPEDRRHFVQLTTGHCLIMGRKTFESIGKPLPKRTSIVITRHPERALEGAVVVDNLTAALAEAEARDETEAFVVGGSEIYALALPRSDRLVLTRVHARVEGDVVFPDFPEDDWKLMGETRHPADERHDHAFTIQEYARR
ncbi:MAG: dihydrofolate reductase [Proteobacteria bacterium]|nr:dihydrofolate reductase [Pseudomonadota bacterium]